MRVVLIFKEAFWKETKGQRAFTLHYALSVFARSIFPDVVDAISGGSADAGGVVVGTARQTVSRMGTGEDHRAGALEFGWHSAVSRTEVADQFSEAFLHDWQADPFARGVYILVCWRGRSPQPTCKAARKCSFCRRGY